MPTPITAIEAAPIVPDSSKDEPIFDLQQENFYKWEAEKLAPGANALGQATFENATSSAASAASAQASALAAEASAVTSLAGSNFRGDWAGLTGQLLRPASAAFAGRVWLLLSDLPDVTAAVPGVSPAWRAYDVLLPVVHVTTASQLAIAGAHYSMEYVGAGPGELILPAAPAEGAWLFVTVSNNRYDNWLRRNGSTFMGLAEDVQLDEIRTYTPRFLNNSWRI